jgi:ATP-dependent Lon protease
MVPDQVALPILPVKNTVLFPFVFVSLSVGRPRSVAAVEAALESEDRTLAVVAQRSPEVENPGPADLYSVGTRAIIKKLSRTRGGIELVVQGTDRLEVLEFQQTDPYLKGRFRLLPMPAGEGTEIEALYREVQAAARKIVELSQPESQAELLNVLQQAPSPIWLVYTLAFMLSLDVQREQRLLEARTLREALELLLSYLNYEIQVLEIRKRIAEQAQREMSREQRQYMLRQQLEAIQKELGETSPERAELEELRRKLQEAQLPDYAAREAERELRKLERLPFAAPDYQVTRAYLELLSELPWQKATQDNLDLQNARQVLDEDHYDLEEVKRRILEHLAVMKLNPQAHGPILCFVGPPGVGKTSLGQSIARALGRKFERMSLGGLHDEAELRGHRRTYIGAMPGRILQAIRRAGVNNPLIMLDEVDKIGRDFRGDPAAALLEILDPAQNYQFRDNYLDIPFDLSKVFFITTANTLDTIPRPLLDRMEVLRLAGYTLEEKLIIARRYLLPRIFREVGLPLDALQIPDDTVRRVIARYTREAGVRELERCLTRIARRHAVRVAEGLTGTVTVGPEDLPQWLGPERFMPESVRQELPAGVAAGLAWTEYGGEVLYVEAVRLARGKGIRLTGSLGTVMRESAYAAVSYVWSHAYAFGLEPQLFLRSGIHIHVPAGAVPKDGPSAGLAIVTAVASLFTSLPAHPKVAMTGEITLSGLVLPVGGIKEKVLAANRAGFEAVILPRENEKDLAEVPDEVRNALRFKFVDRIDEALCAAIPGFSQRLAAASMPASSGS